MKKVSKCCHGQIKVELDGSTLCLTCGKKCGILVIVDEDIDEYLERY